MKKSRHRYNESTFNVLPPLVTSRNSSRTVFNDAKDRVTKWSPRKLGNIKIKPIELEQSQDQQLRIMIRKYVSKAAKNRPQHKRRCILHTKVLKPGDFRLLLDEHHIRERIPSLILSTDEVDDNHNDNNNSNENNVDNNNKVKTNKNEKRDNCSEIYCNQLGKQLCKACIRNSLREYVALETHDRQTESQQLTTLLPKLICLENSVEKMGLPHFNEEDVATWRSNQAAVSCTSRAQSPPPVPEPLFLPYSTSGPIRLKIDNTFTRHEYDITTQRHVTFSSSFANENIEENTQKLPEIPIKNLSPPILTQNFKFS